MIKAFCLCRLSIYFEVMPIPHSCFFFIFKFLILWGTFSLWLNPVSCYFRLYSDLFTSVSPHRLEVQCEVVDSEINHILPAFSVVRRECGLQREPLLFSCAGHSPKYRRLCPCRDFRRGQVALCKDCLQWWNRCRRLRWRLPRGKLHQQVRTGIELW